jgi:DNA-binding NarL/FixJ family response regulator
MIRVVLADDIPLFRDMVFDTLSEEDDIEIVGQAANGKDALALCKQHNPDILLLDYEMPVLNGLGTTQAIVQDKAVLTKVVIITAYEEDELIFQLIQAGASGYLLKDTPMEEVVRAIRIAHSGESLLQPRVAQKVMRMMAKMGPLGQGSTAAQDKSCATLDRLSDLTPREKEILAAIAQGKNNRELADHFCISGPTVKTHVARVMQKLEVRDRVELVLLAVQAGLVT